MKKIVLAVLVFILGLSALWPASPTVHPVLHPAMSKTFVSRPFEQRASRDEFRPPVRRPHRPAHRLVRRPVHRPVHHVAPRPAHEMSPAIQSGTTSCTPTTWRSSVTTGESYIIQRESSGQWWARNPSSGAYGLGQLLPSTYASLGMPMTSNPCDQLEAMRRYEHERYGTESAAVAFWQSHGWW